MTTSACCATKLAKFTGATLGAVQSELNFYQNPAVAITGWTPTTFSAPGAAFSASRKYWYGQLLHDNGAHLIDARLVCAWTPNTDSGTKVRLTATPINPAAVAFSATPVTIFEKTRTGHSAVPDAENLTAWLQRAIDNGEWWLLGWDTAGDGVNGPQVYELLIELEWA